MNDQPRTPPFKLPEDCADMREVRAGVDATDRELMDLLDRRFGYMRAAARIKPSRDAVRDEARTRNLPADKIADLWDLLVETSIAYELVEWERLRA